MPRPKPSALTGTAELNAMLERVAPDILALLTDGVLCTRGCVGSSAAVYANAASDSSRYRREMRQAAGLARQSALDTAVPKPNPEPADAEPRAG